MKTIKRRISFKMAEAKFDELCDAVIANREVIIIKRSGGDVALLPAAELSALMETLYLLKSPRNALRLLAAMNQAKSQ